MGRLKYMIAPMVVSLLAVLDQITKYLAVLYLKGQSDIVLIPGVFRLTYVENFGAAFGTMQNSTIFLLAVTVILLVYLIWLYVSLCRKGYRILRMICLVIIAGGIGNIIDRIVYGFVVDFFYFELIDFPVFNVADCYITCAAAAMIISMFTVYKHDEMDFLLPFGKKKGE